jgi:2-keto-myo-inositol isomerase
MIPCISQVTTLNSPCEVDLPAISRAGWRLVELWLTKVETYLESHSLQQFRELLANHSLVAAAASSQGGLLLSRGLERETHWELFRRRLDVLQELSVPLLIVAADFAPECTWEDYQRGAESLSQAAEVAESRGIRLALEPQKGGRFCVSVDTALTLIAQSHSKAVGLCLDVFHYYLGPSKFEDLAYLNAENLAWVQVSDLSGTFRELASDRDRILPGEGDFALDPLLDELARAGYSGPVSLELLNPRLWQVPVDHVCELGYQSVLRVLGTRFRDRRSLAP